MKDHRNLDAIVNFRSRLIGRLAGAGLLWALIAGVTAYFIETERLDETLVDQAAIEARALDLQLHDTATKDAHQALATMVAGRAVTSRDFFVLAEMYDRDHEPVGEAALKDFGFVEDHFDRSRHKFPGLGKHWYQKRIIDGLPYLQVMIPLGAPGDPAPRGWFEGIYRISPETVAALSADMMRITLLVVVAVLGTAGLLYPLMSTLQGAIVGKARDLLHANLDTLKVLGNAIAKRDSDTNSHNFRVTIYSIRLAERLGLGADDIRSLIKGSFLHDVGKIAIPDHILLKPGKLDDEEFAVMKTHVKHGLDIIASVAWLNDAAPVVSGHHEKVDGSGYPARLKDDDIPLAARIFATADVFDALTSERPYKKPFPVDKALSIMEEGRGHHFDGRVLDCATQVLPEQWQRIAHLDEGMVEAEADRLIAGYFPIS